MSHPFINFRKEIPSSNAKTKQRILFYNYFKYQCKHQIKLFQIILKNICYSLKSTFTFEENIVNFLKLLHEMSQTVFKSKLFISINLNQVEPPQIQMMNLEPSKYQKDEKQNLIIIDSDQQQLKLIQKPTKMVKTQSTVSQKLNEYELIPQIPTVQLSTEDMKSDPIALINRLEQKYEKYGAVKLIASQSWNSSFSFGLADKGLTVRIQPLHELKSGKKYLSCILLLSKPFDQKIKHYRFAQYKQKANLFANKYRFKTNPQGFTMYGKRQDQYWNLVKEEENHEKVTVEYAADLSSGIYGSGFPQRKNLNKIDSDFEYETNLFNLNNIYKSPNSLLRITQARKQKISGISQSWMYVGMQFSTFCWHVQDLFINSINYNHQGDIKNWYVVPKKDKQKFDQYIATNYQTPKKKNLLDKICLMVDPLQLKRAGITVHKIYQRPRQYVVTFFKAYHAGFSHGFNVGEAVNFISYKSLDFIKEAFKYYQNKQNNQNDKPKTFVLSYDWLIHENVAQNVKAPEQFADKVLFVISKLRKQYVRILNRQQIFLKSIVGEYGQFKEITVLPSSKRYDKNVCSYCKNYCFLCSVQCFYCQRRFCERHTAQCKCIDHQWQLVIRQLSEDRGKILQTIPQFKEKIVQQKVVQQKIQN